MAKTRGTSRREKWAGTNWNAWEVNRKCNEFIENIELIENIASKWANQTSSVYSERMTAMGDFQSDDSMVLPKDRSRLSLRLVRAKRGHNTTVTNSKYISQLMTAKRQDEFLSQHHRDVITKGRWHASCFKGKKVQLLKFNQLRLLPNSWSDYPPLMGC